MLQKLKFYLVILCALTAIITISCKKKKDDPQPTTTQTPVFAYKKAQYEKRWNISNTNRTTGTPAPNTLIAIEFVGGVYVLYFGDGTVQSGTYTILSANSMALKNYGTLTVNSLTDTQFGFNMKVDNSNVNFTSAVATQTIPESTQTTNLCKTWKLTQYTILGTTSRPQNMEVTFNKYGTYLTRETEFGVSQIGSNTWMWSNVAQDSICYGAWDGNNITDCNGLGTVSMLFSSDAKSLTMIDDSEGFEIEYQLVLK